MAQNKIERSDIIAAIRETLHRCGTRELLLILRFVQKNIKIVFGESRPVRGRLFLFRRKALLPLPPTFPILPETSLQAQISASGESQALL